MAVKRETSDSRGDTDGENVGIEKTQLLADQVAELEAAVAARGAQIADLEAERAALESALPMKPDTKRQRK